MVEPMQGGWVMTSISQIGIAARVALPGVIYPWLAVDSRRRLAGYQLGGVFMSFATIHRVVTGHDENGKAIRQFEVRNCWWDGRS
jgi:hypothetical protein